MIVFTFLSQLLLFLILSVMTFFAIPLVPVVNRWYQLVIVQSASMEPALKVGSLALYQPAERYEPSDIVAYRYSDGNEVKLILHRIIEKRVDGNGETTYITKGDALENMTVAYVREGQVQGKVIANVPFIGYAINWLQVPRNTVMTLLVPMSVLIALQIIKPK